MLNLNYFIKKKPKNTLAVKFAFLFLGLLLCSSFNKYKHPFYLSVIDANYKAKEQALEISVKLFTNDLEDALKKTNKQKVDLLNPRNKAECDSAIYRYINKRLHFTINSQKQKLHYIGYEKEEAAIWVYLEINKLQTPKKINVDTKLLYDFLPQEMNILHCEINGVKKSSKVTNPDTTIKFDF